MKIIPAANDASTDVALRGAPLAIYRYLLDVLDPRDWHELRRLSMCVELHIGKTAAADALDLLVRRGYIEEDTETKTAPGQARRYRLNFTRRPQTEPLDSGNTRGTAA